MLKSGGNYRMKDASIGFASDNMYVSFTTDGKWLRASYEETSAWTFSVSEK